jgi:hypothetical protein
LARQLASESEKRRAEQRPSEANVQSHSNSAGPCTPRGLCGVMLMFSVGSLFLRPLIYPSLFLPHSSCPTPLVPLPLKPSYSGLQGRHASRVKTRKRSVYVPLRSSSTGFESRCVSYFTLHRCCSLPLTLHFHSSRTLRLDSVTIFPAGVEGEPARAVSAVSEYKAT